MSRTYRQTISDEMAVKLERLCEERGVSLQELTLIALFQLLQTTTCVAPSAPIEETRDMLSFD